MNFHKYLLAIAGSIVITAAQAVAIIGSIAQPARAAIGTPSVDAMIERGEYLAKIGGCHDCHTPGYAQTAGASPRTQWLTGTNVGFKGPWGVSYPSNLRLTVQNLTEEQWLIVARAQRLPPMPWFVLREMKDADVRALYRFFRALGPIGQRAPNPVIPGEPIRTPYIDFMPQNLPVVANK